MSVCGVSQHYWKQCYKTNIEDKKYIISRKHNVIDKLRCLKTLIENFYIVQTSVSEKRVGNFLLDKENAVILANANWLRG